jgi:hypothetical protein
MSLAIVNLFRMYLPTVLCLTELLISVGQMPIDSK